MFNRLWFHSSFSKCVLSSVSYSDVKKCTYYVSTMCGWREGGQRGDWFSLCTNALVLEMGWMEGWDRKREEVHNAAPATLLRPYQPWTMLLPFFCVFLNLSPSLIPCYFFPILLRGSSVSSVSCFLMYIFSTLPLPPYLSCLLLSLVLPPSLIFSCLFWQEQRFYYPTSPLPGWVRYCSGAVFTWHLM